MKSIEELKVYELTEETWLIQSYNLRLTYELKNINTIDSPKKNVINQKNKIPIPSPSPNQILFNKKKSAKHESLFIDLDQKSLKKKSEIIKKLSENVFICFLKNIFFKYLNSYKIIIFK